MNPAGIEHVQINVSDEQDDPAQHLQAFHQAFERERKVFLNGFDDVFEIVEFGSHAFLPVFEIELVVNGFVQFGGVPRE